MAYNDNLINKTLTELVGKPETLVTDTSAPLPKGITANPAVKIDSSLLPKTISASAYQQLMDCPYQFFAARCLGLEPPETIREMLEKSDYGERVHLCLHAFHSGEKNLPGPFTQTINTENRGDAIRCLNSIAEAVFARDLEDNFLHRGWLQRWHELIPPYIDWQIARQELWRVGSTEVMVETKLENTTITLRGRLDRVDQSRTGPESDKGSSGFGIIDYKTGHVANEKEVLEGESIQLPFYALLAERYLEQPVSRVEYVLLDTNGAQTKTPLSDDSLSTLTRQVELRLVELVTNIQTGASMSAWGDKKTCGWCQMSGVCRRESWLDPIPDSHS
jgi:ATP-dependent helicase/nuclease subunit B